MINDILVFKSIIISHADFLLLPLQVAKNPTIDILTRKAKKHIQLKNIQWVTNPFLTERGLISGKLLPDDIIDTEPSLESDYLEHCYSLFKNIYSLAQKQTTNIHTHLKNRTSEDLKITEQPIIKIKFTEIIGQLQLIEHWLTEAKSFDNINIIVNYLFTALNALIEVGGGRSVLKGNTLELLFFCQFFHNLYIKE